MSKLSVGRVMPPLPGLRLGRRLPQDGRTRIRLAPGTVLDARVSTLPTMHGENIVIRLLPSPSRLPNLTDLGLTTLGLARQIAAVFSSELGPPGA